MSLLAIMFPGALPVELTLLDVLAVLMLVLGMVVGLRRGLSGELARIVSAVVVVWAGFRYYAAVAVMLLEHTRVMPSAAPALAFFFIFAGGLVAFAILWRLLRPLLQLSFRGAWERVGGAVLGGARAFVLLSALLFFFSLTPVDYLQDYVFARSLTGRLYDQYLATCLERLPPERWQDRITTGEKRTGKIRAGKHGRNFQKSRRSDPERG